MAKIIENSATSWTYCSEFAMLTEHVDGGKLIFTGMVDNGIVQQQRQLNMRKPSFELTIDGQSLNGGFTFESFEILPDGNTAAVTLTHAFKPVRVRIFTKCCENGFFLRHLEIENTSADQTLALTDVTPFCGRMWFIKENVPENLTAGGEAAYSVGRFIDMMCYYEGNFAWQDIPSNTSVGYRARMGKSGWNNPFFIARNNVTGGYFMCQLAWSGNWSMNVHNEFYHTWGGGDTSLALEFEIKPVSPAPHRLIAPGEKVSSPAVHFGACHRDLDTLIQNCHSSLRANVLRKFRDGVPDVYFNHWGFIESYINEEKVLNAVDIAAEMEAEVFVIDAGWYGDANKPWWDYTGDWDSSPDKFPNELYPIFDRCRAKGLKIGLWFEFESAGKYSKTYKAHPEWIETRDGVKIMRKLDLSIPDARNFIKSDISRVIDKYGLDLVRFDMNIDTNEGGNRMTPDGAVSENLAWRNVEELYKLVDELRDLYPDVQFENCAGGGGRTDIGMVGRCSTTWVSDWMRMPRTVRILNGMSMVLPPEYINRMAGASMEGQLWGDLETQLQLAVMAHITLSSVSLNTTDMNPVTADLFRKYVRIYKNFIRPILPTCRVYHHDPVIPGIDANGMCALEYVSAERNKAVAGIFRLTASHTDKYHFVFKGLDPAKKYKLTSLPGDMIRETDGDALMSEGIDITLELPLTSRMLLAEEIV